MAALADTVGPLLRDRETRAAALDALEAHAVPIERSVSLGAAPALGELLALDVAEVSPAEFDRIGLLLARLGAEAPDDPASLYGAAFGEGRLLVFYRSEGNALAQTLRKPAEELTREDALHVACSDAFLPYAYVRGVTKLLVAAGYPSTMEYYGMYLSEEPTQMCAFIIQQLPGRGGRTWPWPQSLTAHATAGRRYRPTISRASWCSCCWS